MTEPPACTLMAPSKLRAIAAIACLAFVAAGALKSRVPDPSTVFFPDNVKLTGPAGAVLGVEAIVLLVGAGLWLTIALSKRLASRVLARERRSFRVPDSPALVAMLIVAAVLLTIPLAHVCRGDVLCVTLLAFLSFGVVAGILIGRLAGAGIRLGSVLGLGSWRALRRGLGTAVCAFVLLKPVMFAIQVAMLLIADRFGLAFDFQAPVRELLAYPAGSKLVVLFAVIVLIPPFLEEIVFRAFLFGSLRVFARTMGAGVLSAGLFAVLHGAPWQFLHLFLLGMFLALVYEKTQSLYASILLHMLVNAETVGLIVLARLS
ncbi:MAG: type II CAAX endopeptidase family protein [Planctomycetota bacterium]